MSDEKARELRKTIQVACPSCTAMFDAEVARHPEIPAELIEQYRKAVEFESPSPDASAVRDMRKHQAEAAIGRYFIQLLGETK